MKSPYERASYLEALEVHRKGLRLMESDHRVWEQESDDAMVARLHTEVIYIIKEAADRISLILETLNRPTDKA